MTENDLLLLTSVVVTDAGITDISGLEYCTALLGLDLSDNQSSAGSGVLDGVAYLFASLAGRSVYQCGAVDAAEEAQIISVALLQKFEIHADIGLDAVPAVDTDLDEAVQDRPGIAVGVFDEVTAALVDGLALPRQSGQHEFPVALDAHDRTPIVGVIVRRHHRVSTGVENGVDIGEGACHVDIYGMTDEVGLGDHAYQKLVHAHGAVPREGSVHRQADDDKMRITEVLYDMVDGVKL